MNYFKFLKEQQEERKLKKEKRLKAQEERKLKEEKQVTKKIAIIAVFIFLIIIYAIF